MVLEIFVIISGFILEILRVWEININTLAPAGLLLFGAMNGLRHSIEADHVAAVTSIVATSGKKIQHATILGALWGIGHTASIFIAASIILFLSIGISEKISNTFEFGVGIMLVLLATSTLTGLNFGTFLKGLIPKSLLKYDKLRHRHPHKHNLPDGVLVHTHDHSHDQTKLEDKLHRHGHKSVLVGMVHGLAGSGALLLAILPALDSITLSMMYIAVFGAGSIGSMAATSTLIGIPFAKAKKSANSILILRYIAGIATLIIGIGIIYELGIVEKIFQS